MMKQKHKKLFLLTCLSLGVGIAVPALAAGHDLSLLDTLDRGLWQLRGIGGAPSHIATDKICLNDPAQLVQIQHGGVSCTQFVVRSTPNSVTVSYSCNGAGQGLTTIRKETSKLIQIQSQGIMNNAPFSFSVEGRQSGQCR